jgi:2-polyprenyl-3-methyl-5-hydroxy-6-metoxy-1,4-benzoquinol methylase
MEKIIKFEEKLKYTLKKLQQIPQNEESDEVSIPAYLHKNFFVRKLFVDRLKAAHNLANFENLSILDYGCGSGLFLESISDEIRKGIGIDVNIKIAQKIIESSNVEILEIKNSLEISKFREIDIITSFDVLEHIENLESTLQIFKKILKPTGILIISGPTENIIYKIGRKIANVGVSGNLKGSDEHVRNISDIENTILESGFIEKQKMNLFGLFHIIKYKNEI